MGERKSLRFETQQLDAATDMVETGQADDQSKAIRKFIDEGMRQYGYTANGTEHTQLRWMAKELAKLTSYIGVGWLVFFWAFPVQFRMAGAFILLMALVLTGVYIVLDAKEPAISNRLFGDKEVAK